MHANSPDSPGRWVGSTPLIDLEDPRLRLKAQSLTHLCRTEREKALAAYGFVKRIPFARPVKLRLHRAREVLDASHADADDKATLLVALLRSAGVPARLRYVELHGDILRGLTGAVASAGRPVLEAWLDGRWVATDTYIFDAQYVAAARQRLLERGWSFGYGLHRMGQTLWNGRDDAYLAGNAATAPEIPAGALGHFHDPQDFVASPACRERFPRVARALRWNLLALAMNRRIDALRERAGAPRPLGGTPA